jgi:hypothetical protein
MIVIKAIQRIILLSILSLPLFSCVHDDDYNDPPGRVYEDLTVTTDIPTLGSQATTTAQEITTDEIVEGYVISSDNAGNIYKNMYIVSADGKSGLQLSINQGNLYNLYPIGQKVYVKLKGLALVKQYAMATIGVMPNSTYAVDQISPNMASSHIVLGNGSQSEESLVRKTNKSGAPLTLADLDDSYLNTLVEVSGVEFSDAGSTYVRGNANTDNYIKQGAKSIDVRVSQYARFAAHIIPEGIGTVRGVFTKYNTTNQLLLRTVDDVKDFVVPEPPVFGETFDSVAKADGSAWASPWAKIAGILGFDMGVPIAYSDSYGWADIRSTASINNHVWLPADRESSLTITGINTSGYQSLALSYEIRTNNTTPSDVDILKVRCNGIDLAVPSLTVSNKGYVTVEIPSGIPSSSSLTLEFYTSSSLNTVGIRLDNIKITGTAN